MKTKFAAIVFGTALGMVASQAFADLITVSGSVTPTRKVADSEKNDPAGGAPADGDVYDYRVTTDGDILSVFAVQVSLNDGATLFNVPAPFGSNVNSPDPSFIVLRPALGADSWITTPGATTLLGGDLPGDGVNTTFGDTSIDGAQTDFMFARLTVPSGATGTFSGWISILGGDGSPYDQQFSFPIGVPEPATIAMAGMGLIGMIGVARRRKA